MLRNCYAAMADDFVPLAVFLRPPASPLAAKPPEEVTLKGAPFEECAETVRVARRFRAALADALEIAVQELLKEIARSVLARELEIEPTNIAAVVTSALNRFPGDRVVSIRAHPEDLGVLTALEISSIRDDTLERGDVILELHRGTIDLRMEARLEAAVAACER